MADLINIKEAVMPRTRIAEFRYYRDGALWYVTETGDLFPVPVEDIGNATFNCVEKAIHLMRYMRKWNDKNKEDEDG